jgi:hypothetical protein
MMNINAEPTVLEWSELKDVFRPIVPKVPTLQLRYHLVRLTPTGCVRTECCGKHTQTLLHARWVPYAALLCS